MGYLTTPEGKDPQMWRLAQKRAGFKRHLSTYIVVNAFLWMLWLLTSRDDVSYSSFHLPWPLWPTIGWGIGVAFHYIGAYVSTGENDVEKEYDKLQQKHKPDL